MSEKFVNPMPTCSVSHCTIEANSRVDGAMCDPHYQLKYRGVDPELRIIRDSDQNRNDIKCWVPDCVRRARQKGLCSGHASAARKGQIEVPSELGIKLNPVCSVDWCEKFSDGKNVGYCSTHRQQVRQYGKILPRRMHKYGTYANGDYPCDVHRCNRPAVSAGLCGGHFSLKNKYKLDTHTFVEMLSRGECENPGCNNTSSLHIDHDHETGVVRGMLCNGCNSALGMLHENIERMAGLIEYKKLHG